MSTALSEIVVGTVAQLIIGAAFGRGGPLRSRVGLRLGSHPASRMGTASNDSSGILSFQLPLKISVDVNVTFTTLLALGRRKP
jgi:hypothetical protein